MNLNPKLRGSETIWLNAAYDMLTQQGVEAVKVMPLAKHLGLSRTSFYWHFKDREALLEAIIQRWERKNTGNLVAQTRAEADTICAAMFNVFDCWLNDTLFDARFDLAIRNWARNDPGLQSRLDQADQIRAQAITQMFQRFDFSAHQAHIRAMTVIYTQIGYISMQVIEKWEKRLENMPDYVQVFTGQTPSQTEIQRFKARHLSETKQ